MIIICIFLDKIKRWWRFSSRRRWSMYKLKIVVSWFLNR